jgi:hypothetical protein
VQQLSHDLDVVAMSIGIRSTILLTPWSRFLCVADVALAKSHGDCVGVNIAPVLDCWVSCEQFGVGCHNFLRCATHAVTAIS